MPETEVDVWKDFPDRRSYIYKGPGGSKKLGLFGEQVDH